MHPDFAGPPCDIAPGPENTSAIERVTYDAFRLLNEDAHREAPYESTGPCAILQVNAMPAPGSENAERLAHASGDSNQPVSRVGRGGERALPLVWTRRRRSEAGEPGIKVVHASYPAFGRHEATRRTGSRSAWSCPAILATIAALAWRSDPTEIDRVDVLHLTIDPAQHLKSVHRHRA